MTIHATRFAIAALVATLLAGCENEPPFPQIAGQYDYHAIFDSSSRITVDGNITIADDSRETTECSGTFVADLKLDGDTQSSFGGELFACAVRESRGIALDFQDDYTHTGTVNESAGTITGDWVLVDPTGPDFTGTFTATRR